MRRMTIALVVGISLAMLGGILIAFLVPGRSKPKGGGTAVRPPHNPLGTRAELENFCIKELGWKLDWMERRTIYGRQLLDVRYKPMPGGPDGINTWVDQQNVLRGVTIMMYGPYRLRNLTGAGSDGSGVIPARWNELAEAIIETFINTTFEAAMTSAQFAEYQPGIAEACRATQTSRARCMRATTTTLSGVTLEVRNYDVLVNPPNQYETALVFLTLTDAAWDQPPK